MNDSKSDLKKHLTEEAAADVQRLLDLLADDSPEAEAALAAELADEEREVAA